MRNLYTTRVDADSLAPHFNAIAPRVFNVPEETYPGYPALVVHEDGGKRVLQSMVWGFPLRLKDMKPESKPKPVNNIADVRKPMWIGLARKPQWRCLSPLTGFCEAEGVKGAKTRTWLSVKE